MRLSELGSELRRPEADYLRDGVYELRMRVGTVNYRILYGFTGKSVAVLTHGFTKMDVVDAREIERARQRLKLAIDDPNTYTAEFEV